MLQALYHLEPFRKDLLQKQPSQKKKPGPRAPKTVEVQDDLRRVFESMTAGAQQEQGSAINPESRRSLVSFPFSCLWLVLARLPCLEDDCA